MAARQPTYAVGVLSCPRGEPTLSRSLASLVSAGWLPDEITVSGDDRRAGCYRHWKQLAATLLLRSPQADWLLLAEDDAIFSACLRDHLAANPPDQLAWNSLYCAAPNAFTPAGRPLPPGWHEVRAPKRSYGALAYLITPAIARQCLAMPPYPAWRDGTDRAAGVFCRNAGIRYLCHSPSFVRHIGRVSSLQERRGGIDKYRREASWLVDCRSGVVEESSEMVCQ